jgi:hypothetical protein
MPRTRPELEGGALTFDSLGEALGVEATVVMEYAELGLVHVRHRAARDALTPEDLARLSRALRLARELEVHAAAAAMLVELLEERDALRRRIACLEQAAGSAT